MATSEAINSDPNRVAKRNALILSAAQALNGSVAPISIALGGLAGMYLLGEDKSWATFPVTSYNLGVALSALPAAMLMRKVGRRLGFMGGSVVGMFGTLVCAYALYLGSFAVFCVGMIMSGSAGAFVQQFRFAAADEGEASFKPKAISWVLAGGILAADHWSANGCKLQRLVCPCSVCRGLFCRNIPVVRRYVGVIPAEVCPAPTTS